MTAHKNTYTTDEADEIARQLRAITINEKPVFNARRSEAPSPHHVICLDTGMQLQTLEFRKAKEEKVTP